MLSYVQRYTCTVLFLQYLATTITDRYMSLLCQLHHYIVYICICIFVWSGVFIVFIFSAVQPEIFPQGGVKILKSSKDDSIVVAFVVAQAIPPATREQISWVFTSSSGQISIPCANNSEYTFSDDCLSLHIPRVAHKHGGKYQLFARTRAGMGSNAVTLVVTGGEVYVKVPKLWTFLYTCCFSQVTYLYSYLHCICSSTSCTEPTVQPYHFVYRTSKTRVRSSSRSCTSSSLAIWCSTSGA